MPAKHQANFIYQTLKGSTEFSLTEFQVAAIESEPTSPALIIAGAGSGKTELMAVRVLWLVANGYCRPNEILGLTFTRKAAASLSKRIGKSINDLRKTSIWPEALREDSSAPTIATYNSYANALFKDSALALGYEPESLLLSESQRYQLARQVVLDRAKDAIPNIDELDKKPNDLVAMVLALSSELNEHNRSADEVAAFVHAQLELLANLAPSKLKTATKELVELASDLSLLPGLARLAEMFREEKHRLGFVDFSDQVLLAHRALALTDLAKVQRSQYAHVLLDEYQDTSYLQTSLLEGLFRGMPVYAVGDPNQSIYGWRGASSSNLAEFENQFSVEGLPVQKFMLPTSWRNPTLVLDVANQIAAPLKLKPSYSSQSLVDVDKLLAKPNAKAGRVEVDFLATLPEEVSRVAEFFASEFDRASAAGVDTPTAALLLRRRAPMNEFVAALQNRGLSVEVLGLGGLLQMPEVVDLVSALKVINSPSAGVALIRLLTGARWRIGARDIAALNSFADSLARNKSGQREQDGYGADYEPSIVDALDLLASDYREWLHEISAEGLARMRDAALLFRNLRAKQGLPLQELVRAIEQELWLDIELRANPSRVNPMQHLNAFATIVGNYDAHSNGGLTAFLDWLGYAETQERFDVAPANAQAGVVQVMTIHASKGLEWDLVAVGDCSMTVTGAKNLADGDFDPLESPSGFVRSQQGVRDTKAWLKGNRLPYALRGDVASLPIFASTKVDNVDDLVKTVIPMFKGDLVEMREREERRLMYVAFTRPQAKLLVTGSSFATAGAGKKYPNYFLEELALFSSTFVANPDAYRQVFWLRANPLDASPRAAEWPLDPIGAKHATTFAANVADASSPAVDVVELSDALKQEIDLLLEERATRLRSLSQVTMPVRIQASRFKDFVGDIDAMAERFRRPVPEKPYKSTMQGTLFHNWVESRFGFVSNSEDLDAPEPLDSSDDPVSFDDLQRLKATFENSRWADQIPVDVECEIQVTIGSNTFICKIDAVFETATGYEIVDWKTGRAPDLNDEADMFERSLQLALYRMAYARYRQIPEQNIEVCLYFVDSDLEIKPNLVLNEAELVSLWQTTVARATVD